MIKNLGNKYSRKNPGILRNHAISFLKSARSMGFNKFIWTNLTYIWICQFSWILVLSYVFLGYPQNRFSLGVRTGSAWRAGLAAWAIINICYADININIALLLLMSQRTSNKSSGLLYSAWHIRVLQILLLSTSFSPLTGEDIVRGRSASSIDCPRVSPGQPSPNFAGPGPAPGQHWPGPEGPVQGRARADTGLCQKKTIHMPKKN